MTFDPSAVRALFADFPGLHGALDAAFDGLHGDIFLDDEQSPRVARIVIGDFHTVAGDPDSPGAKAALEAVPHGDFLAVGPAWPDLVHTSLPDAFPADRFAFSAPAEWDHRHLAALRESLSERFRLDRVTKATVDEFRDLNQTFVDNFASLDEFLERGVGFAITDTKTSELVAGCSSYTISPRCLEFEIETRRDYQRQGLALVTGARMIEHCLERRLEPCWDAAHEGSALLAERLGFVSRRRYTAYRIGMPPPGPPED